MNRKMLLRPLCGVLTLLVFSSTVSAQTTYYPATGVFNGFLNQWNILECDNNNGVDIGVQLSLREGGDTLVDYAYIIPAYGSNHIILADLVDLRDRIGTFRLSLAGSDPLLGDKLHCRTVFYRPGSNPDVKRFDYAYSLPVSNAQSGTLAGVYNSFDPSLGQAVSNNWLSIVNMGSGNFHAEVQIFDSSGRVRELVPVSNLAPGARQDIPLGHPQGQATGLYVIKPRDNSSLYDATLVRYNQNAQGGYNFAFPLKGSSGSCTGQPVLASTMGNGQTINWLEIANSNDTDIPVTVEVRNRFGTLVHRERPSVPARGQYHVYLSDKIDPEGIGNVGSARVICDDPTDKLIIQSTFYGRVPGKSAIEWAYATQELGREPVRQNATISAPVNTFVGMANWFKFADASSKDSRLDFTLFDQTGSQVSAGDQSLAGGGTSDIDIHSMLGPDKVGSVVVRNSSGSASYSGEMLRVLSRNDGHIGNIISIPGIVSQNGIDGSSFKGSGQSLAKYRDKLTRPEAVHLLDRAVFGGAGGEIDRVVNDGLDATVERILRGQSVPQSLRQEAFNWLDGDQEPDELYYGGPYPYLRGYGIQRWWLTLMLKSPNPFKERMALFWHDRFAASCNILSDGIEKRKCMEYIELLRAHAVGNYGTMLRALTTDYLMLQWLNGDQNEAGSPDQNYAREVMELFSLGEQQSYCGDLRYPCYTNEDVAELARALTGYTTQRTWRPDEEGGPLYEVLYNLDRHDEESKTFWADTPYEVSGNFDPEDVAELLLEKKAPQVARYISGALFTSLCHDHPSEQLKAQMSAILIQANWNVKPLLRRILKSEACFSPDAYKSKVMDPVTFTIRFLKRTGIPMRIDRLEDSLDSMAHDITNPPSVFGWHMGNREKKDHETNYWNAFPIEYANFVNLAVTSYQWDFDDPETGEDGFDMCGLNPHSRARAEEVVRHLERMMGYSFSDAEREAYVRYLDNYASDFDSQGCPEEQPDLYDARVWRMCRDRIGGLLWMISMRPQALVM